ncbi:MAG: HD domain-containing protein [Saprospiraceae bacterium]|nr:HD domain-containing protein [Candidatus Opimibacter iunctus]
MKLDITPSEKELFEVIRLAADLLHQDVYVVGGFVRDRLLGIPCKDMDFVTTGDGPDLAEKVSQLLGPEASELSVFKTFGTAMIRYRDLELEFVGARKESYSSDSRKPSVEQGTLRDDQLRRDFTINALAASLQGEDRYTLIDPFNGVNDLTKKLIITPLDPAQTFSDDPLRMMRAIRFASQLGFQIDPETLDAISAMRDRISIVSMERISYELNKIILSPVPSKGFLLLEKTGLLKIIFPELEAMKGVEQYEGYGHKDNFYHTLQVLDNISESTYNLWLRWSAILHDIAKPATKRFEPGHGWTFHGHEVVGANMTAKIFRRLKLPMDEKMKYVQQLVRLHLRPIALVQDEISDSAIRRLLYDAGDDLDDLMTLCKADITSKNPDRVARYLRNYEQVISRLRDVEDRDHLRNWQPPVTGEIIMATFGIRPGRLVGEIKTAIREAILDGVLESDYDQAFAFMINEGRKHGLEPVQS